VKIPPLPCRWQFPRQIRLGLPFTFELSSTALLSLDYIQTRRSRPPFLRVSLAQRRQPAGAPGKMLHPLS